MGQFFLPKGDGPWHAWTITRDHAADIFGPKFKDVYKDRTGEVGPAGCGLGAEEIRNHPQAKPFRVFDRDGDLRSEGVLAINFDDLAATSSDAAEPFFTICHGFPRTIEVCHEGVWHRFEYQGFEEGEWNLYDL